MGHSARAQPAASPGEASTWEQQLGAYRASAALGALTVDPQWSADAERHAAYTVNEDSLGHFQRPTSPWFTVAGDQAARNGNVMATGRAATDAYAIDLWMQGPFHALGILDPRLERTGFGVSRDARGRFRMAATLDVIRGRTRPSSAASWPVIWPADGRQVPIGVYTGNEYPDPLAPCRGYEAPTGLPILAQFGSGSGNPVVTASRLLRDDEPVEHCVYTESTYASADPKAQAFGRAVLASRDAVVLVPRAPLLEGPAYRVSLTVDGATHEWTFRIGPFGERPAVAAFAEAGPVEVLAPVASLRP